jgi:hypothetical protein
MDTRPVTVFFYGLFMDPDLLKLKGIEVREAHAAHVDGYVLQIARRAVLAPAPNGRCYGMLFDLTHAELDTLYAGADLQSYRPEAVLAQTSKGEQVAALCYNVLEPADDSARNPEYAAKLRAVLEKLPFPAEYIRSVR